MENWMEPFKPADYSTPAKKKRYVESECRKMLDVVGAVNPDVDSYLDGPYGPRRQKAILNFLDRAETDFKGFGLQSVVEAFTRIQLILFSNYNHLDAECDLRIGAALWILDRLRASGKMADAFKILPDTTGDIDVFYLQTDFHHPCYDNDLIQSVIYVLTNRYPERGVLTEENARGKEPDGRYKALLELLPEKDVKAACETFKIKLWELATRKLKGQAYYDKALEQTFRQIQNTGAAPMMGGPVMTGPFAKPMRNSPMLSGPLLSGPLMGSPMMGGLGNTEELVRRGKELLDQSHEYEMRFDKYLWMDRKQVRRESGSREVADAVEGFTVEEPYSLCFALFYLIDHGDDAPWLVGSGCSLMRYALQMLPWYMDQRDWDDDDWDAWFEGMQYDQNGWLEREAPPEQLDFYHEMHGGKNLAQIIYGLCRGVVPVGLHPFEAERQQLVTEGMEEDKARKVTDVAELIFLHAFQAKQYRSSDWSFDNKLLEDEEAEDEEEPDEAEGTESPMPTPVKLGGYWGKVAADQGIDVETTDTATAEENAKLKAELEQAKKQIKSLRSVLSTEKHTADADRAKYERELKSLRMEHRELADLRSLVFNQENEVREEPVKGYSYPYETKKRTVIFGGHDSFLRAIKPMLPNVKFVDANNMTFNPDIIRNADVVWIQNNCISHPQYWSIVKNCKLAEVQMRYFGFASAEKCAEQLATEDLK